MSYSVNYANKTFNLNEPLNGDYSFVILPDFNIHLNFDLDTVEFLNLDHLVLLFPNGNTITIQGLVDLLELNPNLSFIAQDTEVSVASLLEEKGATTNFADTLNEISSEAGHAPPPQASDIPKTDTSIYDHAIEAAVDETISQKLLNITFDDQLVKDGNEVLRTYEITTQEDRSTSISINNHHEESFTTSQQVSEQIEVAIPIEAGETILDTTFETSITEEIIEQQVITSQSEDQIVEIIDPITDTPIVEVNRETVSTLENLVEVTTTHTPIITLQNEEGEEREIIQNDLVTTTQSTQFNEEIILETITQGTDLPTITYDHNTTIEEVRTPDGSSTVQVTDGNSDTTVTIEATNVIVEQIETSERITEVTFPDGQTETIHSQSHTTSTVVTEIQLERTEDTTSSEPGIVIVNNDADLVILPHEEIVTDTESEIFSVTANEGRVHTIEETNTTLYIPPENPTDDETVTLQINTGFEVVETTIPVSQQPENNDASINADDNSTAEETASDTSSTIQGQVLNAETGRAVEGATITITDETGNVETTLSNASGEYEISTSITGNANISIQHESMITTESTIEINDSDSIIQPVTALSNTLESGTMRIVLTWSEYPRDLDSHLWLKDPDTGRNLDHIYYADKNYRLDGEVVKLDRDDTRSFGPETITIPNYANADLHYAVHNYSGRSWPDEGTEDVRVTVFIGEEQIATFQAPNETDSSGDYWHIFDVRDGFLIPNYDIGNRRFDLTDEEDISVENGAIPLDGSVINSEFDSTATRIDNAEDTNTDIEVFSTVYNFIESDTSQSTNMNDLAEISYDVAIEVSDLDDDEAVTSISIDNLPSCIELRNIGSENETSNSSQLNLEVTTNLTNSNQFTVNVETNQGPNNFTYEIDANIPAPITEEDYSNTNCNGNFGNIVSQYHADQFGNSFNAADLREDLGLMNHTQAQNSQSLADTTDQANSFLLNGYTPASENNVDTLVIDGEGATLDLAELLDDNWNITVGEQTFDNQSDQNEVTQAVNNAGGCFTLSISDVDIQIENTEQVTW